MIDNISLFSLGNPDFINELVSEEFFSASVYQVVLDTLVERDFILDHKVSLIAQVF